MKLVNSKIMRRVDRLATEKFGIPSLILMENAGRSTADAAEDVVKSKSVRIAIICGYGNNGGDGFVCARHLINRGYRVEVYLIGKIKNMSNDAEINFSILIKMKTKIKRIINKRQINSAIKNFKKSQLIIDAIFGIGIKGKLDEFYCELFKKINHTKIPILSLDIPSGLDADSGKVESCAIKARHTVAMGLMKKGFLNPAAKRYLGKIFIADISLPKDLK
jgi:NAD(P)H-hydrate epimerase